MASKLSLLALMLLGSIPAYAQQSNYPMLPPTLYGSNAGCGSSYGAILTYNAASVNSNLPIAAGSSAINCDSNHINIDPTTGFIGIGTATPHEELSLSSSYHDTWFSIENTTPAGNDWGIISSGTGSWGTPGGFAIGIEYSNFSKYGTALEIVPQSFINYNVGINTIIPQSSLDVNGEVRVGNIGTPCSAANEGAMQYDSANHVMDYCNGTKWTKLGGSGPTTTAETITCSANSGSQSCAGGTTVSTSNLGGWGGEILQQTTATHTLCILQEENPNRFGQGNDMWNCNVTGTPNAIWNLDTYDFKLGNLTCRMDCYDF